MKNVLIIDAPDMLRNLLTDKLLAEKVTVETADSQRDAVTKMFSILPDLIILNIRQSVDDLYDFLDKKKNDLNGKKIPIIMTGPVMNREDVADLVQYGVVKYFTQPIKFDVFFESIGRILRLPFTVDDTPCVLDVHLNKDIIFIEVAMGLNQEKIGLLKYKISEIIDRNELTTPKVILMLTSLSLSFVDGYNLELLFQNITADKRIMNRNIKILSLDSITKEFIDGHIELHGIEVVENLSVVLNSLVEDNATSNVQEVIADNLLTSTEVETVQGSIETRFSLDTDESEKFKPVKIAVIDDDPNVRAFVSEALKTIASEIVTFSSGVEFLTALNSRSFDLAVLDIYMPGGPSGFDVLKNAGERGVTFPIIIYSQMGQKEYIMQALSMGAASYLVKPQKPENLVHKIMEILNG
ncbi:MAG: response regulator [Treponema sp.]|nr:response regulator [Candidatus Treponema equifaecale]